jgi:molybdopterin-containing oxidoreductase family iron-sulfur binding subunit
MESPEFREAVTREFPAGVDLPPDAIGRRDFLKLIGASLALAGLTGCLEKPHTEILPYTFRPVDVLPGNPTYYATTMTLDGFGTGLLVESREGRPTKVEGNPDHPANLGAASVYDQASVLQLYDPNRARYVRYRGRERSMLDFVRAFSPLATTGVAAPTSGAGLHFLLEPTASPFTAELIARVRAAYPGVGFTYYSPLSHATAFEGTRLAFGRPLQAVYDFLAADVVVSLDSDFLSDPYFGTRYSRHFTDRRRIVEPTDSMNRLYAAEGRYSITGGIADNRIRVPTSQVGLLAQALMSELGGGAPAGGAAPPFAGNDWVRAAAADLRAHAGRSLVIAGERQPPEVQAIAHAINGALGNIGRTVRFTEPLVVDGGTPSQSLAPLVEALRAGAVRTLVIVGANPVYNAPVDYDFKRLLARVPEKVYCGLYRNETALLCDWMIPGLHYLEQWGDARAWDGTASIVQPLIRPLYGGMTVDDVLKTFLGEGSTDTHELLWNSWRDRSGAADFDRVWAEWLQRGVIPGTAAPTLAPAPVAAAVTPLPLRERRGLDISFHRDAKLYDGRFADNGWLQELPDPMTKQTWGNAAVLSPRTAYRLGIGVNDLAELSYRGRTLLLPVLILPGQVDDEVAVNFGYGRLGTEVLARGVGSDTYAIWTSAAPYFDDGVELRRAGTAEGIERVATTQTHWTMEGRPIALRGTLDEYRSNPDFTEEERGYAPSLYNSWTYRGEQWAMTIDLTVCTGCSACVVACQAENNSPVVGKESVLKNREMHWLRIDRYFHGEVEEPRLVMQPMLCQHCEKAPCEYVCPVNATVHSHDGLNEMIYNRCVGTRFCSNNCPYKVRRFNFFDFNSLRSPLEAMQLNPDVTVRARGVMEKCTYCVQRIRRAEIKAQVEGRTLKGDEVVTACAQTCPTHAIVFGSLGDPDSEVSRSRLQPRMFAVLHDLGTQPRTRYLARITNPNPSIAEV